MHIYLATSTFHYIKAVYNFRLLTSYHYITPTIAKQIARYKGFMLDSGIFTYLKNPAMAHNVDWYKYAHDYATFVKKYEIEYYIEIDVDRFIGLEEVEKLRTYIESIVGWKCMPVWHINRGWDKWVEICKSHPYVCFGAFITDNLDQKKFKYIPAFLREAAKHGAKVHGLGFTTNEGLKLYKFHSVDSSTWNGARFGQSFTFEDGMIKQRKRPQGKRAVKISELVNHNLQEWIKFSEYAERYY